MRRHLLLRFFQSKIFDILFCDNEFSKYFHHFRNLKANLSYPVSILLIRFSVNNNSIFFCFWPIEFRMAILFYYSLSLFWWALYALLSAARGLSICLATLVLFMYFFISYYCCFSNSLLFFAMYFSLIL